MLQTGLSSEDWRYNICSTSLCSMPTLIHRAYSWVNMHRSAAWKAVGLQEQIGSTVKYFLYSSPANLLVHRGLPSFIFCPWLFKSVAQSLPFLSPASTWVFLGWWEGLSRHLSDKEMMRKGLAGGWSAAVNFLSTQNDFNGLPFSFASTASIVPLTSDDLPCEKNSNTAFIPWHPIGIYKEKLCLLHRKAPPLPYSHKLVSDLQDVHGIVQED